MKKSALPIAIVGGLVLSGTVGGHYALAATPVSVAQQDIGQKYVWGGNDCSGFTMKVFSQFGISLPHSAAAQANYGTYVSQSNLQPGDLVFFSTYAPGITHVGIYVGGGYMISSENEKVGVRETQIFGGGASSYWAPRYITARRLISSGSSNTTAAAAAQPAVKSVSTAAPAASIQSKAASQPSSAAQTSASSQQPASAQTQTSSVSAASASTYKVQTGDTLSAISLKVNVSVSNLKAINGLSSDSIKAGQTLNLKGQALSQKSTAATAAPAAASSSASSQPASSTKASTTASAPTGTTVSTTKTAAKNTYIVSTGDTLWAISRDNGISIQKIQWINHLKSTTIYPGQKLSFQNPAQKYTIKKNDTLWGIATSHGITVSRLIQANNLTSTTIYPNQQLVIPQ